MVRISDSFPNLFTRGRPLRHLVAVAACIAALAGTADRGKAQTREDLPSAPEAQASFAAPVVNWQQALLPLQVGVGVKPTDMSPVGHEPQDPPITSMFPHPENSSWWLSGQANIIFQGRLPFHSLYEGPNSFRNSAEYKTSMVGTLYTALRPPIRSATTQT